MAGFFYPGESGELHTLIQDLLSQADRLVTGNLKDSVAQPKALIVPHAGYVYSGLTAACAYRTLLPFRERIRRVILLGPSHRVWLRGLAFPSVDEFQTPLGSVPVETDTREILAAFPQVSIDDAPHRAEHSLEVQLPFLKEVLQEFSLVPFSVGEVSPEEVGDVLDRLWGGTETLIVVSSDLSHYMPYATAVQIDRKTADAVTDLRFPLQTDQACGGLSINGLLWMARRKNLMPQELDLRNSGDTAGDRDQVVGYGAFAFYEKPNG